mgnify:CR=1 FL=1
MYGDFLMGNTNKIVILVTASNKKEAEIIAKLLIEERLAACVNIVPTISSIYSWEGKVHHENESLMLIKTTRDMFDHVNEKVEAIHSYDTVEIISLEITQGSTKYLQWIDQSIKN